MTTARMNANRRRRSPTTGTGRFVNRRCREEAGRSARTTQSGTLHEQSDLHRASAEEEVLEVLGGESESVACAKALLTRCRGRIDKRAVEEAGRRVACRPKK
jgi:hypothetical protein